MDSFQQALQTNGRIFFFNSEIVFQLGYSVQYPSMMPVAVHLALKIFLCEI